MLIPYITCVHKQNQFFAPEQATDCSVFTSPYISLLVMCFSYPFHSQTQEICQWTGILHLILILYKGGVPKKEHPRRLPLSFLGLNQKLCPLHSVNWDKTRVDLFIRIHGGQIFPPLPCSPKLQRTSSGSVLKKRKNAFQDPSYQMKSVLTQTVRAGPLHASQLAPTHANVYSQEIQVSLNPEYL